MRYTVGHQIKSGEEKKNSQPEHILHFEIFLSCEKGNSENPVKLIWSKLSNFSSEMWWEICSGMFCINGSTVKGIRNRKRILSSRGVRSFEISEWYNLGNINTYWIIFALLKQYTSVMLLEKSYILQTSMKKRGGGINLEKGIWVQAWSWNHCILDTERSNNFKNQYYRIWKLWNATIWRIVCKSGQKRWRRQRKRSWRWERKDILSLPAHIILIKLYCMYEISFSVTLY